MHKGNVENDLTVISKIINYLQIDLTMEIKDLYTENSKTLMKKIEDTNGKSLYK